MNNSADALLFRVQGSYAAVAEETVGVTSDLPRFVYITFSAAIIELQNQRPGRTVSSVYIPVIMSQQPAALHWVRRIQAQYLWSASGVHVVYNTWWLQTRVLASEREGRKPVTHVVHTLSTLRYLLVIWNIIVRINTCVNSLLLWVGVLDPLTVYAALYGGIYMKWFVSRRELSLNIELIYSWNLLTTSSSSYLSCCPSDNRFIFICWKRGFTLIISLDFRRVFPFSIINLSIDPINIPFYYSLIRFTVEHIIDTLHPYPQT